MRLESREVNHKHGITFTLVKRLSDGLVLVERTGVDGEVSTHIWARVRVRKPHQCAATLQEIPVGAYAYAPAAGTQKYRAERIAAPVVDTAIA